MSRLQTLTTLTSVTCTLANTPYPLTADTSLYVKSMIVQSKPSNTGSVSVGDATNQELYLDTGQSATIQGDNMDNGTSAKLQVASIYVKSTVAGDKVTVTVLEKL